MSQVCVESSPRGCDIRHWSGTALISVCEWECVCKWSVRRLFCWAGRQCVCLQSTQWPLSGLHSALKLSGSVLTAWSECKHQGNGSPVELHVSFSGCRTWLSILVLFGSNYWEYSIHLKMHYFVEVFFLCRYLSLWFYSMSCPRHYLHSYTSHVIAY